MSQPQSYIIRIGNTKTKAQGAAARGPEQQQAAGSQNNPSPLSTSSGGPVAVAKAKGVTMEPISIQQQSIQALAPMPFGSAATTVDDFDKTGV
jgi:hypothetical protein